MRFGVNLPNFGPLMDPEGMLAWARGAEELGFDTVLLSDHVALTDDAHGRSPAPFYECLTTIGWLAGQTDRLRIGAGVLIGSHRHPALLARATATLDQLSGGRLIVGVGVGWAPRAFDVLGVDYHRRGRITDEVLDLLVASWTHDQVHYDTPAGQRRVHTGPRPVQRPHPPLWIGGGSPRALERANRVGTAWHPLHPSREAAAAGVRRLTPGTGFAPRVFFLPTRERLHSAARPLGMGSLDQIRDDIGFLTELGAETIVLDTDPGDQRLRRPWAEDLQLLALAAQELGITATVRR